MSQPQLFSGARGIIYKDEKAIAVAIDITVTVREGVRQTYVMGSYVPAAQDPTSIDVDCSIGRVIPLNPKDATSVTPPITSIDLGLEDKISDVLTAQSLTITIQDKISVGGKQNIVASIREARFQGRNLGVNAADIANERLNFVGIYDSGFNGNQTVVTGYDRASDV
jgi:hypothetical protein